MKGRIKFSIVEGGSKIGNEFPVKFANKFVRLGHARIWKGDKIVPFLMVKDYGDYELEIL